MICLIVPRFPLDRAINVHCSMLGGGGKHSCSPVGGGRPGPDTISVRDPLFLRDVNEAANLSDRRTQDEVQRLAYHMKQFIIDDHNLKQRLEYFWPDPDQQEAVLLTLAHDVPNRADPLEVDNASYSQQGGGGRRRHGILGDCVSWLGLVNKLNRYACIELKLPETFEPWYTYTNRLMVYLFAEIPSYGGADTFNKVLNINPSDAFPMKCRNPLCIKLQHIDHMSQINVDTSSAVDLSQGPLKSSAESVEASSNEESEESE